MKALPQTEPQKQPTKLSKLPAPKASDLPDYAPVPRSALGPALNKQGFYVGRVERNLYWITDGVYQSAFLTTRDGVVLLDALVYSQHHADASSLFDKSVTRIGHEETRQRLLRDLSFTPAAITAL